MLDLVASLACHLACFHVPAHYVRLEFEARAEFLRGLQLQGRLEIVRGRAAEPESVEYVWLVAFCLPAHRQLMMR